MSEKLDQSLDQILADRKQNGPRGRGRAGRRVPSARAATKPAPAGGVQKKTKGANKPITKATTTNGTASLGTKGVDTKIIVSNLPRDVDEKQIQEYFAQSVGPVKRVWLQYGPNGKSSGHATIQFSQPGGANKAFQVNNGVLVEGRPMKVEIVVDASRTLDEKPKSLSDRINPSKSVAAQPKSAAPKKNKAGEKATTGTTRGGKAAGAGTRGGRGDRKGKAAGRPKRKTADQLDAEMTDYFQTGTEAAPNGTVPAAPAADADTGMDEVL